MEERGRTLGELLAHLGDRLVADDRARKEMKGKQSNQLINLHLLVRLKNGKHSRRRPVKERLLAVHQRLAKRPEALWREPAKGEGGLVEERRSRVPGLGRQAEDELDAA